jgi:uncharacterized damage-inducible protein DinB
MATSSPTTILLASNHWATANLLDACSSLSDEQFHQSFEMGPGSLHDTLTHILGAMRGWTDLLTGRTEPRDRLEVGGKRTAAELRTLLDEIAVELADAAQAYPHDEEVSGERGGRSYTFTRGAVITHVTTHGMHHRAQCLNMLRQLGIEPLPPSAVVEWMMIVDGQG